MIIQTTSNWLNWSLKLVAHWYATTYTAGSFAATLAATIEIRVTRLRRFFYTSDFTSLAATIEIRVTGARTQRHAPRGR